MDRKVRVKLVKSKNQAVNKESFCLRLIAGEGYFGFEFDARMNLGRRRLGSLLAPIVQNSPMEELQFPNNIRT